MNRDDSALVEDAAKEISGLVETMLATERRLEFLTGGEVDAVADNRGGTFLLRRGQDQLRHSDANRQAAILNALPANVALLDSQGVIISVNEGWRSFGSANGWDTPGSGIGQNYLEICEHSNGDYGGQGSGVAGGIRAVLAGTEKNYAIEYPCHSAVDQRWFLLRATPLEQRGLRSAVVMHVDITARKLAEEALRESEERFRQLAENIQEVFWLTDPVKNQMLYVSPAYEKIWGRTCESLQASPETWLDAIHPEDRPRLLKAAATKQTAETYDEEYRIIRPDGSIRWIRDQGFPIRNVTGEICRIAGIARDITDRKRAEHQTLRTQRLESIGTLAGGVAHDLNNALAPILMGLQMLRMQYPLKTLMIDTMETSALRGADMVRQLLTFAKGVEGARLLIQPRHLLREVEKIIRSTFPKNIELRTDYTQKLKTVLGDSTQLHQVLVNLCVNARDAMPDGGTLSLVATNADIDEASASAHPDAKPGSYVVWQVKDTGTGIPVEIIERIFDPFFTTKGPDKGTGFGLSTVLGIVKSHGGFVHVDSQVGQGSTFSAYLPASETSTGDTTLLTKTETTFRGNGETILVVDDDAAVRQVMRSMLTAKNFNVLTAADGTQALIEVAEKRSELRAVITDLHMPHMDGLNFVRVLKRMLPEAGIIVASGRFDEVDRKEFKALGIDSLLDKPFSQGALVEALECIFEKQS